MEARIHNLKGERMTIVQALAVTLIVLAAVVPAFAAGKPTPVATGTGTATAAGATLPATGQPATTTVTTPQQGTTTATGVANPNATNIGKGTTK